MIVRAWFVISIFVSLVGHSQNVPLNTWRSHFSYNEARIIEQAESTIFCAVANGFFTVDVLSGNIQKLNKENGLGDTRISSLHYAKQASTLVIGYESGVIDLIDSKGAITTIRTLRDTEIVGEKQIYDITSVDESAYLATSFGVVLLDLNSGTVKENYRNIGTEGNELSATDVMVQNDSIYVLSADGIRSGALSDNLLDFNVWTYFQESSSGGYSHLISSDQKLYTIKDQSGLWKFDGMAWRPTGISIPNPVRALFDNEGLLALTSSGIFSVLPSSVLIESDDLLEGGNDLIFLDGDYWVADGENGLLRIGANTETVKPEGPLIDEPTRIKWVNGQTYTFSAPEPPDYVLNTVAGFSIFEKGNWTYAEIPGFKNITDVASFGGSRFFTSLGFGLYDESQERILNQDNSSLVESGGFGGVQLSAVQSFDGSLWITSYNSSSSLYQLTSEGSILAFSSSKVGASFPLDMDISTEGVLWMKRGTLDGGGITTFDPALDLQRTFRTSDNLPTSTVSGISIDADDEVWISTTSGVANFGSGSFPFNDFDVSIPVFQNGFLFEDEAVNDVLTDGGGRIWFATQNGVWVLSRDLTTVVHQFTIENSPLPSDNILQFAYDEPNGEVFILTDKGLVSYRSASSAAKDIHSSEISIFPNPVNPGFSGTVGLSGLARNAIVKITDARGRLVRELVANGGTASWDLRTFRSARVQSGVYLVFSSSEDGMETLVGKIAVLQ